MVVCHLLILSKELQFYIFVFEAWKFEKFKGAEYFRKALHLV